MSVQLTLPLCLRDDATFKNFYPGKNQALLSYLQAVTNNPGDLSIYIWGHRGVGCSHLLQACCQSANEQGLQAVYIPLAEIDKFAPGLFENLEMFSLVCLDDIQMIAGKRDWEEALFHLYNRTLHTMSCLVIAGKAVPQALGLQLADLVSRLTSSVIFQVQELNDVEKLFALRSRAKLRGLELSQEVGQFLFHRAERNLLSLFSMLEKLDHASLVSQRKLTIPFVKMVLGM